MRLIDAEETKRNLANSEEVKFKYISDFNKLCAFIDSQPTVAASPWHRVDDDYPDLLQFVVVCNDDGKCVVAQYVGYKTDSLTPWRIAYTMYDTDAYYEMENGPVRYWMPIKPPKEDA